MNNEILDEVQQAGEYKNFFSLTENLAAIASKGSMGTAITDWLADKAIMDGKVTKASTNVNGMAANKDKYQNLMAAAWDEINGDARVYARPRDLELFEKIKYTKAQIIKMGDAASYGVCEVEWTVLSPLVGTTGFPTIITNAKLDAAKVLTNNFKGMVGAPDVAHKDVNTAIKYLLETSIPAMKSWYTTFNDLSISMAHAYPDFVASLLALHKEYNSGIHHRGFTVTATSSVDGSFIRDMKIEFPDYANEKKPVMTNSMGYSDLITMRIGQWKVRCTKSGWAVKEFKPIFKDNEVTHIDIVLSPI